jgi:4-hydroxybenzoate polyprenyltransferase
MQSVQFEAPRGLGKFALFARDIKISHTVFAMPWALLSMVMAGHGMRDGITLIKIALILICMVAARTVAMASNRLLDARLDAANPRTARRAIPAGILSRRFYLAILASCAAAFGAACGGFWVIYRNPWPIALAGPVLVFVAAYPLLKRFTQLCHFYLGAALALAPVCAWVAIRGNIAPPPLLMAGAVLCWTAGFDIIYACQDFESDVAGGIFSAPSRLGIARALWISRLTHAVSILFMVLLWKTSPQLHAAFGVGILIAIGLLTIEHWVVRPTDLRKVGLAFFTLNGIISTLLGGMGILDCLLGGR